MQERSSTSTTSRLNMKGMQYLIPQGGLLEGEGVVNSPAQIEALRGATEREKCSVLHPKQPAPIGGHFQEINLTLS